MKDRLENSDHCAAYFARGDGSEIIEAGRLRELLTFGYVNVS